MSDYDYEDEDDIDTCDTCGASHETCTYTCDTCFGGCEGSGCQPCGEEDCDICQNGECDNCGYQYCCINDNSHGTQFCPNH